MYLIMEQEVYGIIILPYNAFVEDHKQEYSEAVI